MTYSKKRNGGYAGLMLIVLGAGIVVLLFTKLYLSPQKQTDAQAEFQATNASGTVPTTEFGRARANEDAARAVAEKLNEQGKATNLELE
jgi:hypothetical protein